MPLAQLQRCCGGSGTLRNLAGIAGYYYHPEDDISVPCWNLSGDYPFVTIPGFHPAIPGMGYDSDRDWMIYSTPASVRYQDFRACTHDLGLWPDFELLDGATGAVILENALPTGGTYRWRFSNWAGVSKPALGGLDDWRLYGYSGWCDLEPLGPIFPWVAAHFTAWSVKYDGSDYTEHFTLDGTDTLTMSVMNGNIITCQTDHAPSSEPIPFTGQVRVNGGSGGSQPGVNNTTTGGVSAGGDVLGIGTFVPLGSPKPSGRHIFVNGSMNGLYFAFSKLGGDYLFTAYGMGWDHKRNGLVILWGSPIPATSQTIPLPPDGILTYATLSTGSISEGNIIGQPGTTVYAFAPHGGGYIPQTSFTGSSFANIVMPPYWAVPVTLCEMPRPVDPNAYYPPDPPDPRPTCDRHNSCGFGADSLNMLISLFEDCNIPDDAGAHPYNENYTRSNLNGPYTLEPAVDFPSGGPNGVLACVSTAPGNYFLPLCDYYSTTDFAARRADPGEPWHTDTYDEINLYEFFVAAIGIEIECENGLTYISKCHLLIQQFISNWDGTGYNDPFSVSTGCEPFDIIAYKRGAPISENCTTNGIMSTTFLYDSCGSQKTFTINAAIGPVT